MALELKVCRGHQLIPCPLLHWDPINDQTVVLEEGQLVKVRLSEHLPFSKTACREINNKPQMLSTLQAKALLYAAGQLKLENRWLNQITKSYREMLQSVANHHQLPTVKILPTQSSLNSKLSKAQDSLGGNTKQISTSQEKAHSNSLMPYQIKRAAETGQREKRRKKDEQLEQELRERELRKNQIEGRRLQQSRQRQVKRNEQRIQQAKEHQRPQEESARKQTTQQQEERMAAAQAARQARQQDLRLSVIYHKIQLTTITVPGHFKHLDAKRFAHWLPTRLELELETGRGPIFVPLVDLLSGNSELGLCEHIRIAQRNMSDDECFALLKSCLDSKTLHTTPAVLDLLESLYKRIQRKARDHLLFKDHLRAFSSHLNWRRRRCAEAYGYRVQELDAQTAARSLSLLKKIKISNNRASQSTQVHRASEWDSEWDSAGHGKTNYNPSEYK